MSAKRELRRVLIISPRFPPMNAPDHHRVRTSLPFFSQNGWEVTLLAVTPETSDGVFDPLLSASVPKNVRVERVAAWRETRSRRWGFGHLEYRCVLPLYLAGTRLLKQQHYDVIYFSTTVFTTFLLAPLWKRRFGCRIVFDFQDPWYQGSEHGYTAATAPGGWTKFRLSQAISRYGEPLALRAADHIISVSPGYVKMLSERYPRLTPDKFTVIPFGAAPGDFTTMFDLGIKQDIFRPNDGLLHWVYVGRGGPDMVPVLAALFRALAQLRVEEPELVKQVRMHFVGTNYSPANRTYKVVAPVAAECGVADLVSEHSERVPYFIALSLLAESDAVLLIGSTMGDYTASKLFNCVLSKKPVLALFHRDSLVGRLLPHFPNARLAAFNQDPAETDFSGAVIDGLRWLLDARCNADGIDAALAPYLAERLTAAQCAVFDQVISR